MNEPDLHLLHRLQTYPSGANVHTVNKAYAYYKYGRLNSKRRANLGERIRVALVNHDWTPVKIYMRRWF